MVGDIAASLRAHELAVGVRGYVYTDRYVDGKWAFFFFHQTIVVLGPAFSHIGEIDPGPRLIFRPFSCRSQNVYTYPPPPQRRRIVSICLPLDGCAHACVGVV